MLLQTRSEIWKPRWARLETTMLNGIPKIEEAKEDESLARREYERHLAIHGCNE